MKNLIAFKKPHKLVLRLAGLSMATMFLATGLLGCANNTATSSASSSENTSGMSTSGSSAEATVTVGLMQIVEHPSLNTIRESFTEEMQRLGYGYVKIDYQNAQGDMSTLNTIAQKFVGDKVNAIVAIATPSAIAAASATKEIPIIFSAATDPVAAKLLTDPAKPEGNVTGVSDAIPVEKIFAVAKELTPEAKTFGFVYNLGEVNSVSVIEKAKAYCDANGLSYVEATVTNSSEVQQAAQSLIGKVDAYFTPIDNTVASAMPTFSQVALEAKLPIYTGADSMVVDGGLATSGIDYTLLGKQTAEMTVKILEGTPVSELPVITMEDFRVIVNQSTAKALGIDISGLKDAEIVG